MSSNIKSNNQKMIEAVLHSSVNLLTLNKAFKFERVDINGSEVLHAFDAATGLCYGPAETVFAAALAHSKFMHGKLAQLLEMAVENNTELPAGNIYQDYLPPFQSAEIYLNSHLLHKGCAELRSNSIVKSVLQSMVSLTHLHDRNEARKFGVMCMVNGFYDTAANTLAKTGLGFEAPDMVKLARKLINRVILLEVNSSHASIEEPVIALWEQISAECDVLSYAHDPRLPSVSIGDFLALRKSIPLATALIKSSQSNFLNEIDFGQQSEAALDSDDSFELY